MSQPSRTLADDSFGGRRPTSHERMTGLPWDASYHDGPAPWEIGQPQPAIVRLASDGAFAGAVLDAGCGTGENAIHLASLGLSVLGVDVAETALATAREKAKGRGIKIDFIAADASQLESLGRTFRTVLDCGLFHTFDADERQDQGSDTGPHPLSQEALKTAFDSSARWNVASIAPDQVQTRYHDNGAPAWLAVIRRT
jgi:SAM-dependent methyltransferase